jgi:hypothetical protein
MDRGTREEGSQGRIRLDALLRGYYVRSLPLVVLFWAIAVYLGSRALPYVAAALSTVLWLIGTASLQRSIRRERSRG